MLQGGNPSSGTWHYSPPNSTWTHISGFGGTPPPRARQIMVYDSKLHLIIIFGGNGVLHGDRVLLNDIWFYDPEKKKWTDPHPLGPPPGSKYPIADLDPKPSTFPADRTSRVGLRPP